MGSSIRIYGTLVVANGIQYKARIVETEKYVLGNGQSRRELIVCHVERLLQPCNSCVSDIAIDTFTVSSSFCEDKSD